MKRAVLFFLICWITLISGLALAAAPNNLTLEDQTVLNGQVLEYYAYETLTAGPNFVIQSGGEVALRSSGKIMLEPGFVAELGSRLILEIVEEPPNIAPVAEPLTDVQLDEDTRIELAFSATDEDGDTLTFQIASQPANGSIEEEGSTFYYRPNTNYFGGDSFEYKANDGRSDSNNALVTILVNPVNDPPRTLPDSYEVDEDITLTIQAPGVLINDSDIEGDSLDAVLVSAVSNGGITLNPNGSFEYVPNENFNGTDTFSYVVNDGPLDSNISTVTIIVRPMNDNPVADNLSIAMDEDSSRPINLTATDIDGDNLTFNIVSGPQNGSLQGAAPNLTYTPSSNYFGADSFTFTVSDGNGGTDTKTVVITIYDINDPPVAENDSYSMHLNTTYSVAAPGFIGNDYDIENSSLSAILVSNVQNGTLVFNSDGSFAYTPTTGYQGEDEFTYRVTDGFLESQIRTVTIRVTVKPVAYPQSVTVDEDNSLAITLTGNDQLNNPITYTIVSGPENGSYTGSLPNIVYTPTQDYSGQDTITFRVNNGMEDSDPAIVNITVNPLNDPPVANSDEVVTDEDSPVITPNVLTNDTDVEGDTLTVESYTQPSNGSVAYNDDGTFTYTPNANYYGSDNYSYVISDQTDLSAPATINIEINPVDDIPVPEGQSISTPADTPVAIILTGSDIESDPFTFELVDDPQSGTLSGTPPNLTYTPTQNEYGDDAFTFRLVYNGGESFTDPATVNIRVKTPEPQVTFISSPNLVKAGGLVTLSWTTQYADQEIVITPDIGDVSESGSTEVFPDQTIEYTLTAIGEGGTVSMPCSITIDDEAPQIEAQQPTQNQQVNIEALQAGILVVYSDNTGIDIEAVKIFRIEGEIETDMSSLAVISNNSIRLDISGLENGTYRFKIVITDTVGNETILYLEFAVDKVLPATTPSIPAGEYSKPFSIDLNCSETATIYYSTDGSPPFEGGSNTISGPAPIIGIEIDHSMNLQYFAKDSFGNIEPVQSAVYLLGIIPDSVTGLSGLLNDPNVDLNWDVAAGAKSYSIYRALSKVDVKILEDSINGGYAPPDRLKYFASIPSGSTTFSDTALVPGMTYYYGVTQTDQNDVEGILCPLVSIDIPEGAGPVDSDEAIQRALTWLEKEQNKDGSWGNKEATRMLSTSQVLNAYNRYGKNDLPTSYALFYLRGNKADNNDFLSRKIITLGNFNQNVDLFINHLIAEAYWYNNNYLYGWGVNSHYKYDALDTVFGLNAIEFYRSGSITTSAAYRLRNASDLQSDQSGSFGWINGTDSSVYVSCLVYSKVDQRYPATAPNFDAAWIIETQTVNGNGSFGNGLIDTSAVLLWLDSLTDAQKSDAVAYLLNLQSPNGSWNNDPYLSGLCLEALLK